MRTQARAQPIDVARDGARALRGQAAVDEIPREVALDQRQSEEVAQPREHLLRARIGGLVHRVGERLPLQQLAVRAGSLDQLRLVLVEQRRGLVGRQLGCRAQSAGDVGDHLLHAVGEQLLLVVAPQPELHRAGGRAEVGDRLSELAESGAVEHLAGGLADREAGERGGIRTLELLGEIAEQALADQLQEHVVVTFEGDVDVEVVVQVDHAVLGEEPLAAARLPALLDGVQRVPRRQGLQGGGERLEVFALVGGVGATREDAVELLQQLVVREELGVDLRQARQQPALVLGVIEQHDLVGSGAGVELTPLVGVGDRDVQRQGGRGRGGTVEGHAALDQGAEHREEATTGAVDVGGVAAVGRDVAIPIEQVLARHAHVVEVQPAVVDAVEPTLDAVVLSADAGEERALVVAQRNEEAVHAVVHAAGDQLGEDGGGLAVQRGVAEVVLPRPAERRVDDEFLGLGVVGRGGADGGDVGAVAGLGHRERAGQIEADDVAEPQVVVLLGAQLVDRGAEQAPLHAGLDLQARVGEHELFEPGEVRTVVFEAAVLGGEGPSRAVVVDEEVQLLQHACSVLRHGLTRLLPEHRVLDQLAHLPARLAPRSQQRVGDGRHVDPCLVGFVRGVRRGRRTALGCAFVFCGRGRTDSNVCHDITFRRRRGGARIGCGHHRQ